MGIAALLIVTLVMAPVRSPRSSRRWHGSSRRGEQDGTTSGLTPSPSELAPDPAGAAAARQSAHARGSTSCSASSTGACSAFSSSSSATSFALVRFRKGANPAANYAGMKSRSSVYVCCDCDRRGGPARRLRDAPRGASASTTSRRPGRRGHGRRVVAEQFAWNVIIRGPTRIGHTDISRFLG